MITRFAPSPTGFLHLGHAFSALSVFEAARAAGGVMLLRIEDIDQSRCRAPFEAAIFQDLAWLGLSWPQPVRRQSEHLADYAGALSRLIALGVTYRCFKTRKELAEDSAAAPHGFGDVVRGEPAPDEAERLAAGQAFAWRLWIDRARDLLGPQWDRLSLVVDGKTVKAAPARLGDVILARKDFPASYHLASVWDDAAQGVTDVLRGEDLREAADLHVLLQTLLSLPHPAYRHHRLLTDETGRRFSKRDGDLSLRALREAGATPEMIRTRLKL